VEVGSNNEEPLTGAFITLNADGGDIQVNVLSEPGNGNYIKTGSHDVILLSNNNQNNLSWATDIQEGRLRMKANLQGATTIREGAELSLEHTSVSEKKIVEADITGEAGSALSIHGGWMELNGSVNHAGTVSIGNEEEFLGEDMLRATLSVSESFNPTGVIDLNGLLLANIHSTDTTWVSDITGVGALKKYGAHSLTLTGNLDEFTGAMQVFEGLLITNTTIDRDLEVYAGATLLANIHNGASTQSSIEGNIFGNVIHNDGKIYLGNNSHITQTLSAEEIHGHGYYDMIGNNHVRIVATGSNINDLFLYGYSGEVALNGLFDGYIYSMYNGTISFEAGTVFDGYIFGYRGQIKTSGFNIDRGVTLDDVDLSYGGILDISVDKINDDRSENTTTIRTLRSRYAGSIKLRPDISANEYDAPLLTVTEDFEIEGLGHGYFYNHYDNDPQGIFISPIGRNPEQENATFNLIQLGENILAREDIAEVKEQVLMMLKSNNLYSIESADFDDNGLLTATLRLKDYTAVFQDPSLLGISKKYKFLGEHLLKQHSNTTAYTHSLYKALANTSHSGEVNKFLAALYPVGIRPAETSRAVQTHSALVANKMLGATVNQRSVNRLLGDQGVLSQDSAEFLNRTARAQWTGSDLVGRHIAHAADPQASARLKDFQHIDINGFSLGIDTSYAQQNTPTQSDEEIGNNQHSWSTSTAATYTVNPDMIVGVIGAMTKTHEDLNPNQQDKTAHRSDRYNHGGILGYYKDEERHYYLSSMMTYGQHNYEAERTWVEPVADIPCSATSAYKAYELYGSVEAGLLYTLNDHTILQPYAGITLSTISDQAYSENSINVDSGEANDYGVAVPKQSNTNQLATVGLEVISAVRLDEGQAEVMARAGWTTQKLVGDVSDYTYAHIGDLETLYPMEADHKRFNTFDLSLGLHADMSKGVFVSAMYTGNYGKYSNTHTAMMRVDYYIGS
jgi:hypothetical protein